MLRTRGRRPDVTAAGDGGDDAARARLGPVGMAAIALAYGAGAQLGFVLRFPPATTSVLWPPNAILTAAGLLAGPRRYWQVALFALPAHLLVELHAGFPLPLACALFLTNCAEGFLTAAVVEAWSDEPTRFDSLRRVLAFVGAALAVPLATSFADAGAVHLLRDEPFQTVFFRRAFSNVLTQLALVPSAVALVRGLARWRRPPRRVRAEAVLFAVAQLVVGAVVLGAYHGAFDLPGGPFTALPLLMPLLVFAAVRFGPAGASLSLLATALTATGIAVWRASGAAAALAEERVLALQVFLIVAGAPLLCLSALVEERRQAAAAMLQRLRFEQLIAQMSAAFVHAPNRRMDEAFADALARLGSFLGLTGAALAAGGGPPLTWRNGGQAAVADAEWLQQVGPRARLALPLTVGDEALGTLVLAAAPDRGWSETEAERARVVGDVFASALARQRAENEAHRVRDELAHCLRLSTIGELTSSIAHELNQPLAAILANAQAARRLLAGGDAGGRPPDLDEILADIVTEDRRAGDVIRGLRALMRRDDPQPEDIELNQLIGEVLDLVANDAKLREVDLRPDLAGERLVVRGDRVRLQQVVLNLLLNALEAMAAAGARARALLVRTRKGPGGRATVWVEDTGPGLPAGPHVDVFQPFYTTKPNGMGMGLSIARSIVEAHGGAITAGTAAAGGASFTFTLPLSG